MGVEAFPAVGPDRPDRGGAEADVGDIVPVHHVEMDPVGTGLVDLAHLLAQPREIGGQDGGCDQDRLAHGLLRS